MYKILANTLFLGKEIIYMPSCHSTNDEALQMLKKPDTREGLIVLTDNQTKGRGQRGNVWVSGAGVNLIMSIILKPGFLAPTEQFYLNIISSLAVAACVQKQVPMCSSQVKWPNDVLLNGKKISGILIENTIQKNSIQWSVVGIGLNVNQSVFQFSKATSLLKETGYTASLPSLFEEVMTTLEYYYLQLKAGKRDALKQEYLSKLFGYREFRKYRSEFVFEGQILDVLETGQLQVQTPKGVQSFDFKEIEFIY